MQPCIRQALRVTDIVLDNQGVIDEQRSIHKDRKEFDHLSFLCTGVQNIVLQTEVKSVDPEADYRTMYGDINKGIDQLTQCKDYLERMHGSEVKHFWYSPALALSNLVVCLCAPAKKKVAEIRMADSQIEDGVSLDPAYDGKKYHICSLRIRGSGCSFFKWDCDESALPQTDPDKKDCDCVTIKYIKMNTHA